MGSVWIYVLAVVGIIFIVWVVNRFDSEGRLLREIARRTPLDDRAFQDRFYRADNAVACVASDVRRICAKHLGLDPEQLLPSDDLQLLSCELNITPLVDEIQNKYGCNAFDDSPKTPYTLADLIHFVLNTRPTVATSPPRQ